MQKWKVFNKACGFLLYLCWRAERRSRRKQVKTGEQRKPQRPVLVLLHPHHTFLSTDSLCFSLPLLFFLARKFAVSMALFPDLTSSGVKPVHQGTPRHEPANSSQLLSHQDSTAVKCEGLFLEWFPNQIVFFCCHLFKLILWLSRWGGCGSWSWCWQEHANSSFSALSQVAGVWKHLPEYMFPLNEPRVSQLQKLPHSKTWILDGAFLVPQGDSMMAVLRVPVRLPSSRN